MKEKWNVVSVDGYPEDLEPVFITWSVEDPPEGFRGITNRRFVSQAVRLRGGWQWWSGSSDGGAIFTQANRIGEYVEVVAWMRIGDSYESHINKPEPYTDNYT